MSRCVCGREAVLAIPDEWGLSVFRHGSVKPVDKLCRECFDRVQKLQDRFRFTGVIYTVIYYPEENLFVMYSENEYGDRASLSERDRHLKKQIRSLWTGEVVFMDGDEVTGVL